MPSTLVPRTFAALLALCLATCAAAREDQVRIHGQPVGAQQVDDASGGVTRVHFHYVDRGRGDDLHASWTLDATGLPVRYEARGQDYWHAPIEERFEARGGTVTWRNRVDAGERPAAGPAFYMPANSPPEWQAVLARALLKAPGHRLPLLPSGEAQLREVTTLKRGAARLTLYHLSGLDFTPDAVWLHADGRTAAVLTDWLQTLAAPFLPLRERMVAAQDRAAQGWHAELARQQARRPVGDALLIRNARLFDPRDLSVRERMSVRIIGTRIVQVDADDAVPATPGTEVLDAQGRFLMPGLWDVHQHFSGVDGVFDLVAGVTSARDMANDNLPMLARVKRFDAGTELGPRVVLAGIVEGVGPLAGPTDVRVDTAEKARAAVDWYADHGYAMAKIYSSVKPGLIEPIATRAHARGMRVGGHVPAGTTAAGFVAAGADEISHLSFLVWNFFPDADTRGKERYTLLAQKLAELDLDDGRFDAFVGELKRRHTVLDPTMTVFEGMFAADPGKPPRALQPVVDRFPVTARRQALSGAVPVAAGQEAVAAQALPRLMRMLKRLHDAGIVVMPGTDSFAGYSLHRELELWVEAGIPAPEVLRLATLVPARVLGAEADRGVIAPGKRADMVLVDGDPSLRIGDIRRIFRTIKDGRVIDPAALEQALGLTGSVR